MSPSGFSGGSEAAVSCVAVVGLVLRFGASAALAAGLGCAEEVRFFCTRGRLRRNPSSDAASDSASAAGDGLWVTVAGRARATSTGPSDKSESISAAMLEVLGEADRRPEI